MANYFIDHQSKVRRLAAAIHSKEVHHRHELKKKERENARLKERLTQLLADKVPDRKVGESVCKMISGLLF